MFLRVDARFKCYCVVLDEVNTYRLRVLRGDGIHDERRLRDGA